jgi:hypothetical protein
MALMKRMMDCCDMDGVLSSLDLPAPGSNRGYKAEGIIKSFLVSVWCGANRFMHTEVTRHVGLGFFGIDPVWGSGGLQCEEAWEEVSPSVDGVCCGLSDGGQFMVAERQCTFGE